MENIGRLGILAGAGELPLISARNAREAGLDIRIYLLSEEIARSADYSEFKDSWMVAHILRFGALLKTLKADGITHLLLLGKVSKEHIFSDQKPDLKTMRLLAGMKMRNDDSFFFTALKEFTKNKITVLPQGTFLQDFFLKEGVYSRKKPRREDREDIHFGLYFAHKIGELDIGQTVVAGKKSILAVEAIEGTDECIRRGGKLSQGKGAVVCKAEKPGQDERFDMPTVGIDTLNTMKESGAHCLAIEEGKTFVVNPQEFIAHANKLGIIFVVSKAPDSL